MTNEKKKGFFARLFAGRACCRCNTQIEEIPEADAPATKPEDCCKQAKPDDKNVAASTQEREQTHDHKVGGDCCCQDGNCK